MKKQDIQNFDDLHCIVKQFYSQAMQDPIIGFFFTQVSPIELETHTPKVALFWQKVLFGLPKIPTEAPKNSKNEASVAISEIETAVKTSKIVQKSENIQQNMANMLQVHLDLDDKARLQTGHFTRWLHLFIGSIDELYAGENAEKLKQRAKKMASSLSDALRSKRGEKRIGVDTLK